MRQLIKRFGIKITRGGRIVRTGRVFTPNMLRPMRKIRKFVSPVKKGRV